MTLALYNLDPEYACFADLADEDQNPTPIETILQSLEEIEAELAAKALSLAKVVRGLDTEATLLEDHARSLLARAQVRRQRADFLKRWLKVQMQGAGVDRLRDAFVTVWLQTSPASVEVVDEEAVPAEFRRAVLRLPYSLVPAELHGFVQHLDVERAAILELTKRTGEVPAGVIVRSGEKHVRIR